MVIFSQENMEKSKLQGLYITSVTDSSRRCFMECGSMRFAFLGLAFLDFSSPPAIIFANSNFQTQELIIQITSPQDKWEWQVLTVYSHLKYSKCNHRPSTLETSSNSWKTIIQEDHKLKNNMWHSQNACVEDHRSEFGFSNQIDVQVKQVRNFS